MYKVALLTEAEMNAVIHDCLDMIKHHHDNVIDCARSKATDKHPYDPRESAYFHDRLVVWMSTIERKNEQYENYKQCR